MGSTHTSERPTPSPGAARQRTVLMSLGCDIGLWIPEILAFVLSGSVTLFADVLKCGNEILATVFALIILIRIRSGGQFSYDYGMGKFESITRTVTGAVMLVSIFIIFVSAFQRLYSPEPIHPLGVEIGIPLMVVTAIIDTYLWRKNYRIAQASPSPIMEAQWRLRRAKAFADVLVLASLVLSIVLAGFAFAEYIDPAVSFVIIGFLLVAGWREISSSLPDLFDKTLEEELQILILRELSSVYPEYNEFFGVRSRRSGSTIHIEIFLGFDPEKKQGDVQDFSDALKRSLEKQIEGSNVFIVPTREPPLKRPEL